ncbi:unnamed protein product [Hymenolepis diminuta]|uniref:ETS domain-containing protein n=2 Tax=Hymenolepis diminuta TaxID=6216 RepID=A0A0R3SUW7_HYMDI|nr:unnamed protein product [Hymenolepis diminuta]
MLIPATVKAELSPEYPESDCQQQASQQSSQEGQSQQRNQDCDMPTDCSAFRPKSPRKSVSEGFSTPPVNISSSGLPSAFKSPQSLQSSVSPGNAADDLSCRGYNGSPDTPEVESLEIDTTKSKVTLWQFLLQLLMDPRYSEIIRWTNNAGEFVLLKAEEVARLWGLRKDNNHRMNYDKLSRALRYYYQKNIIRKVQGHKFVYQFIGLQGLCNPNRQMGVDNLITNSDQTKHQRRQSAPNKPTVGMSPESAFSSYSAFRKQTESFMALQQHQQSVNHDVSKLSQSAFERSFPTNLSQTFDYSASSTPSNTSSSFHPVLSSSACDLSKLYANLPKNHEPLHLSRHTDENTSGAMDLHSCKGSPHDFLPHSRPVRRSCSPDCNCSCHNSVLSNKTCENRVMHFNSWGNQGFRKPQSMDCWPPSSSHFEDHSMTQPAAFDQRSALHLQRHMINMNRFTEEIKRFSTWGVNEERKVPNSSALRSNHSTSNTTPSDTIFRPFDVPKSGSEAMDTEPNISRGSSQCPSSSSESQNSANGGAANGNYIWMPIQVDLIEHFMSMISQTIQDNKTSKEPPAAHSSSS